MLCSRSLTATCTWKRFMVFSFPGGRAGGTRTATATAVLREVTDEFIHVLEIGAVDDEAAFGTAAHEAGAREVREMERERGGRQLELLANQPRRQSCGSGFDQQAVDLETSFLCQGSERVARLCHFHISRIMETTWRCQCAAAVNARLVPDLGGDLDDARELRPLLVFAQRIAVVRAREAALRREAQVLQRHMASRLVDAALERIFGFERTGLGRDEAQ